MTITLVSGLPRSGTSLVMRMLGAGGHPLCYDQPEAFESSWMRCRPFEAWIDRAEGQALKWLAPFELGGPPVGRAYRTIALTRDARQQARSVRVMASALGLPVVPVVTGRLEALIARDNARLVPFWAAYGPVLHLTFEEILACPEAVSEDLADFCVLPDPRPMAAQVLARGPEASQEPREIAMAHDPALWHGVPA